MPVKPLNASALRSLLDRIENACEGEIRSIIPLSPTSIQIRLSVQDKARGYDWIDVMFQVEGVNDARLLSDAVLCSLDMSEGITVEIMHDTAALAIGRYDGRANEAPLYVIGKTIGYEELPFSG